MASSSFFLAPLLLLLSFAATLSTADYVYEPKSDDTLKSNKEYVPKPHSDGPKPEYDHIPKLPKVQVPKPEHEYVPQPHDDQPEYGYVSREKPLDTAFEGLVLCKLGSKYIPVKGAVARLVCSGVDEKGYETTPFSCLTGETDEKGYFLKTFSLEVEDELKVTECKAYLESSSMENCRVPSDVNNGVTGALLSTYRILSDRKLKLYSVGPFFFTPDSESIPSPTGY